MNRSTIRVLLVQENVADAEQITAFCLTNAPHLSFTVAASRAGCWAELGANESTPFDALIVDDTLADSDGMTVLHQVIGAGYPAPVIMVTVRDDVETAVAAMKAGATDYIVKSTSYWEHLPRLIDSAIARYDLMRENQRLHGNLANYAAQLEESVRQARIEKARLQTVLEQLPEGVVILEGKEGRTVAANKAAERLWGHAFIPDVCISEYGDRYSLVKADGSPRPAEETALAQVLRTGEPLLGDQSIIVKPNGERITVLTNAAPLLNGKGEVNGAVAVFQDISEIKKLESLKDEVLSIASHELKNPLTIIKGYSTLIVNTPTVQQDPRAQRIANTIHHQSERMEQMVERLLDLSRLGLGKMTLTFHVVEIVSFVRNVAEQQESTMEQHHIVYDFPLDSLTISADAMRLEQVLVNLLSNAAKYSPDGGDITLSLQYKEQIEFTDDMICGSSIESTGPFVEIEVCDHGIGIEPEMQQKLFSRFYRTKEAARLAAGQGLGLYISAEIVRMHGGALCVSSSLQRGSRFSIMLPITR